MVRFPGLWIAMLLLVSSVTLFSQTNEYYIQVDYMKCHNGKAEEYVWMEESIYKPIHQERIKAGEISAWYLYQVQYPRGADTEYDYVTLTFYDDFSLLDEETANYADLVAKAHPDKSLEVVAEYAAVTRDLVRSEALKSEAELQLQPLIAPKTLLVDYMKVTPALEDVYLRMETEIWQPLHRERLKRDLIANWGAFSLLFPSGMNYPYSHVTLTGFENWADITDSWPEDIWSKVHPEASQEALEARAHEVRDLVSTQIWKLVDHCQADQDH